MLCVVTVIGRSLVQSSPTEYCVSECDREASVMRRPWPTRGCCAIGRGGGIRGQLAKPINIERGRVQELEVLHLLNKIRCSVLIICESIKLCGCKSPSNSGTLNYFFELKKLFDPEHLTYQYKHFA